MAAERVQCVAKTAFYEAVDVLRSQQKTKQSQITLFVEDKFYNKAKQYLKSIIEDDLIVDQVQEDCIMSPLLTWEATTITPKKWKYSNHNIVTEKKKKLFPSGTFMMYYPLPTTELHIKEDRSQ